MMAHLIREVGYIRLDAVLLALLVQFGLELGLRQVVEGLVDAFLLEEQVLVGRVLSLILGFLGLGRDTAHGQHGQEG